MFSLLVKAAHFYITDPTIFFAVHGTCFNGTARAALLKLLNLFEKPISDVHPSFVRFMNVTLKGMTGATRRVKLMFLNHIYLFEHDPGDKKSWSERIEKTDASIVPCEKALELRSVS